LRAQRSNPTRTAAALRFDGLDGILMQRELLPAQSRLDLFFPGQGRRQVVNSSTRWIASPRSQ